MDAPLRVYAKLARGFVNVFGYSMHMTYIFPTLSARTQLYCKQELSVPLVKRGSEKLYGAALGS